MNGNGNPPEDKKSRARAFFEKALSDLKKTNHPLAEFYLQAAVKEDPENQEYKDKLEEVQKVLARDKEAAEQAKALEIPSPDLPSPDLFAPSKPKDGKKPGKTAKKGPTLFGIPVKNINKRAIFAILGILFLTALGYSIFAFTHPENTRVNIADIKKIYGIELRTASVGEGKLQGVITGSWSAMPREEREKKVKQLFRDYHESRGIKSLVFWDENYSAAAEVSESGVTISP